MGDWIEKAKERMKRTRLPSIEDCDDVRRAIVEIERLKGALEQAFPTEADLDWLMTAFQREHPNPDIWMRQHAEDLGARAIAKVIVSVWEAGRIKTEKVQKALKKKST